MTTDGEMDTITDMAINKRKNMELGHKWEKISQWNRHTRWERGRAES